MKRINQLFLAAAFALPLMATAQTSTGTPSSMEKAPSPNVKPPEQPRSKLEADQTTKTGDATKYPGPGTDTGGSMSKSTSKTKTRTPRTGTNTTPAGDVPTYPAPARDGTPTK